MNALKIVSGRVYIHLTISILLWYVLIFASVDYGTADRRQNIYQRYYVHNYASISHLEINVSANNRCRIYQSFAFVRFFTLSRAKNEDNTWAGVISWFSRKSDYQSQISISALQRQHEIAKYRNRYVIELRQARSACGVPCNTGSRDWT